MNQKSTSRAHLHLVTSQQQHDNARSEQIVVLARLHLYNRALPCGAGALRKYLAEEGEVMHLPSVQEINRILDQHGLSHGRTGWYPGDEPEWLPASANIPVRARKEVAGA
jgi:hypothetical protein